jgi:putative Ca2+/H+ antiporter (TMEM165/GDT1 family)
MAGEAARSWFVLPALELIVLHSFLVSSSVVALAEVGDKTQLLSLVLAAKYRKPLPIVLGVLVATLVNHAGAGGIGTLLSHVLSPNILNWAVVASFVLMAGWILVPDKLDDDESVGTKRPMGIFATTVVTFFLAEMGDKTQIVTIALAARFHDFFGVVSGTTMGMMLANVPVIYLGNKFADRLPTKTVHIIAALIFVVLGGMALRTALNGG